MKYFCEKCNKEVPENEVISFPANLKGGQIIEPKAFEHDNCGGEVIEKNI